MKHRRLKWIESAGGPFILISDKIVGLWSGILNRNSFLANGNDTAEEAKDFLNPDEADYGKACSIKERLGLVKVDNEDALILGGEPSNTTFFYSLNTPVLARLSFANDRAFAENALLNLDLNSINDWEFALEIHLTSDRHFLFDSACSQGMLSEEDYLQINIKQGSYRLSTALCEPDNETQLILHKFDIMDLR